MTTGASMIDVTIERGSVEDALADVASRLRSRFPRATDDEIADAVRRAQERFTGARVLDFVPVLVEREARSTLAAGMASAV